MTITAIKEAWKLNQNVIYNNTEYEIYSMTVWKDKDTNAFHTGVVIKDIKANSIIQVDPEKVERIKEC